MLITLLAQAGTFALLYDSARILRDSRRRQRNTEVLRMAKAVGVDAVDRRIVAALQRDGRRPFTSIADELGVSEATVRQRVARLQAAGIMQVVAVTDPMTLGYKTMAMVGISVDGGALGRVAEAVRRLPEVSYLVLTAGSFDMLAEVVCEDNDHLLRVLSEDLAGVDGVRQTQAFMYLRLLKEAYTWSLSEPVPSP
jgi:Lrp/AsnC family transcriptional regulator, regulator for asnA, asnC and gidA